MLTDQEQVLIWLTAVDAVFDLLDRKMSRGDDLEFWLYWVIRSRHDH